MTSLNRSLSLAMDEFYNAIRAVGVSAITGEGMDELFGKFDESAQEFNDVYLPDLLKRIEQRQAKQTAQAAESMQKLQADLRASKGDKLVVDVKQPTSA